jgi:signal transduction histidine kinase
MRALSRLSVRVRTTLVATAIVAVALGVAAAALVGVLRASLNDSAEAEASRRATVVAGRLAEAPAATLEIVDPDVRVVPAVPRILAVPSSVPSSGLPAVPESSSVRAIPAEPAMPAGPVVPTEPGPRPDSPAEPGPELPTTVERWPAQAGFATAAAPAVTPSGPVTVQARASLRPAEAALDSLRALLLPGVPALLLLVVGLTWLAVGRAIAPVTAIRRELADITANDLHRRVPVPRGGDEIAALAVTTNNTLDRLESAVERHRRFVADAAHELRSPLAILRTRMELAPPQPLTTEALTDLDRIQRLAADLLVLAGLDAGELPARAEVDLGQVVAEEAVRTRARAEVAVLPEVEAGLVVHGSAEHLRRLVANLVDNAVRHAERRVEVRLTRGGGGAGVAVLEVVDDGPGIPLDQREEVFDRFTRLDAARDRDAGGVGLGLAIARDIAVRHGGVLVVAGGPPGGHLRAEIPLS